MWFVSRYYRFCFGACGSGWHASKISANAAFLQEHQNCKLLFSCKSWKLYSSACLLGVWHNHLCRYQHTYLIIILNCSQGSRSSYHTHWLWPEQGEEHLYWFHIPLIWCVLSYFLGCKDIRVPAVPLSYWMIYCFSANINNFPKHFGSTGLGSTSVHGVPEGWSS